MSDIINNCVLFVTWMRCTDVLGSPRSVAAPPSEGPALRGAAHEANGLITSHGASGMPAIQLQPEMHAGWRVYGFSLEALRRIMGEFPLKGSESGRSGRRRGSVALGGGVPQRWCVIATVVTVAAR